MSTGIQRHRASRGPRLLPRLLTLAASIVIALLLVEVLYRAVLALKLDRQLRDASFGVVSEPLYEFDEDLGYLYAPGRAIFACRVSGGRATDFRRVAVNALGNLDADTAGAPARPRILDADTAGPPARPRILDTDTAGAPARPRILAFGDSFTANPRQPYSWTRALAEQTGAEVLNFGRDGYGVLQMFHLVAVKTRELKPDLAIVAFIVDDLERTRTWRTTVESAGRKVMVVSTRPSPTPELDEVMELDLVDPGITPEWFQSLAPGTGGPFPAAGPSAAGSSAAQPAGRQDPVIGRLTRGYEKVVRARLGRNLWSLRRSAVLSKIRFGDGYRGCEAPSWTQRLRVDDFALDPQMARDIRSIQVPLLVVLLPTIEDFRNGKPVATRAQQALYASLERLLGRPIYRLADHLAVSPDSLDALYLLPADGHPSPAGSRAFARGMAEVVRERTGAE